MITMCAKRVFKTKTFARWAKKILSDAALCDAAREIEQGIFEADLGGGVCKKRVAIPGQGKSGSARTLAAKKNAIAIIFIVGREKNEPAGDFSESEELAAKGVAKGLEKVDSAKLDDLVEKGVLIEICLGEIHEHE